MKASFVECGEIEIDGRRYDYDVVIDKGAIRKRKKKPSKEFLHGFLMRWKSSEKTSG